MQQETASWKTRFGSCKQVTWYKRGHSTEDYNNLDLICQFNNKMKITFFKSNVNVLLLLLNEYDTWQMTKG